MNNALCVPHTMNATIPTSERIAVAIAAMGAAPLTPERVAQHIRPLFTRVLQQAGQRIYLANHSLGRPLDAMEEDVQEGLSAWYGRMGEAWSDWGAESDAYRARLGALLGASTPDTVIPKTSAGQGLRAVLNSWNRPLRVVASHGEFDSLDIILREYAQRQRVHLRLVDAQPDGCFATDALISAIVRETDLVVLSPVMFQTGQRIPDLVRLIAHAHAAGAKVLLDVYHALGVIPIDVITLDADFVVGGCYKYLRGGPGAAFLYVHPRHLASGLRTLDTGWLAKEAPFDYVRHDPPRYAPGGDGWLESTPAVLPLYQARAGLAFTLAVGVERLRTYGLALQHRLIERLKLRGMIARGGTPDQGAFVVVHHRCAPAWAERMHQRGIVADARGEWLRLCPDVLTTLAEIDTAADVLAEISRNDVQGDGASR